MAQNWFVHKNGKQLGPYTLGEIKEQLRSNFVTGEDYIWNENMSNWSQIKHVEELALYSAPAPQKNSTKTGNNKMLFVIAGVLVVFVGVIGLGWWGVSSFFGGDDNNGSEFVDTNDNLVEEIVSGETNEPNEEYEKTSGQTASEQVNQENTIERESNGEISVGSNTSESNTGIYSNHLVKEALVWYLTDVLKSESFYVFSFDTIDSFNMSMDELRSVYGDLPFYGYYYDTEYAQGETLEVYIELLFSDPPYSFGLVLEWDDTYNEWVPMRYIEH
ncbi:DUF4339 domain-containing protein [Natranaerofaba carboxydovora]|uniref:DUF4339 domain-containing protein n=1 Tax=Natranaerofaba carboxydovora TaxID=2742683 RepID=UPI001F135AD8|nr:DUF4339 domain-containing protein [Natranaerofaba carboxydovora]UMZ73695.1 hypothetical protein ACONDI_01260 [Natranaerofaba carboxydovora]